MTTVESVSLPALDDPHSLSADEVADYRRDGHLVLRNVCSATEIAAYRQAVAESVGRLNTETRPLVDRDTYGKAFLQVPNIWRHDAQVAQFVKARRFARLAAELMGVSGVRIYHDQALFKEPGGGPTPWHQDRVYWPLETDDTITLWMPLVDVPAGMDWVSGSHLRRSLADLEIGDAADELFDGVVSDAGMTTTAAGPMRAGDASFHAGWSLHRAPGNTTKRMREVMTVIYVADGTRVGQLDTDLRVADRDKWLPGLKTGDLVDSELNPLLWVQG